MQLDSKILSRILRIKKPEKLIKSSSPKDISILDLGDDPLSNIVEIVNYDNIKNQIETSTENYIKQFEALQKPDIVDFFMQVQKSLIQIVQKKVMSLLSP